MRTVDPGKWLKGRAMIADLVAGVGRPEGARVSAGARGRSTRGGVAISAALVLCLLLSVALLAADVWVSGRLDVWVTCGYWVTSGIVAVAGAALACTAATSPSDREAGDCCWPGPCSGWRR